MTDHRSDAERDRLAIDTLRFLAVDMVERAESGHPGAPMGLAPLAHRLWTRHLRHDPAEPTWPGRDRFVLSCGHASALLYGLLHLSGYDLPMAELEGFRQLGSKTPGHPEHGLTAGVETTTGPLGQGFGNAVGMAIAQRLLAARFDREGFPLFDHRVWVIASDGDLMEGVAGEAASLAGHLRLSNLVVFYDDNRITIDGPTDLAFSDDSHARFRGYGWHTLEVADGNDLRAIDGAIAIARDQDRPTLVVVRTHIGYGSPNKQDSEAAHGSPLGADEVKATKENLGWPLAPTFHVPEATREVYAEVRRRGAAARREWLDLVARYRDAHPDLAAELDRRLAGRLPDGWTQHLPRFTSEDALATRQASGKVLNALAPHLPELVGGSADLSGSNGTMLKGEAVFSADTWSGRNFHFGVREHAMGAALNGMALSRALRPYGGTFLVFSDYMRAAVRLAALMELPVVFVYTHDSIFLGEDGPTHQPESHLASLRAIPQLVTLRPADAAETAAAWRVALERHDGPTALALTRQKVPTLAATAERAMDGVPRGAYVLADADADAGAAAGILLATGSEVSLAMTARDRLQERGIAVRVVSMPSWELFRAQDAAYRESVLPPTLPVRLAVEAGSPLGWHEWIGARGDLVAHHGFGASAPAKALAEHFGFTPENVAARFAALL